MAARQWVIEQMRDHAAAGVWPPSPSALYPDGAERLGQRSQCCGHREQGRAGEGRRVPSLRGTCSRDV